MLRLALRLMHALVLYINYFSHKVSPNLHQLSDQKGFIAQSYRIHSTHKVKKTIIEEKSALPVTKTRDKFFLKVLRKSTLYYILAQMQPRIFYFFASQFSLTKLANISLSFKRSLSVQFTDCHWVINDRYIEGWKSKLPEYFLLSLAFFLANRFILIPL